MDRVKKKELDFGNDKIFSILLRLAPPVMLAQLIQALYNIIDSFFIGNYSESGLTALSIIYPIQLLMIALAVGTGVGINTLMAHFLGVDNKEKSDETAGVGNFLAFAMWFVFALICWFIMPFYAQISTNSQKIIDEVIVYGRIVCVFSFGLFFESIWTKVMQATGNMKIPMIAQIAGAFVNIALDPLLIFGIGFFPELGISGAAIATVSRTDCGGFNCNEKRLQKIAENIQIQRIHKENLLLRFSEYSYAVCIHIVYIRIKSNIKGIFRSGSHRFRFIL